MLKKIYEGIKSLKITMEPIILLLAACNTAASIVSPFLKEQKMKRYYIPPPDLHGKDLDKFYNKKMVMWDNYYEYVNLPIACIMGIIYGGISDHRGRKVPLLVGISSIIFSNAMNILIWNENTNLSLHFTYVSAAITGLLGDFLLTMNCINAVIVDTFEDKTELSYRMILISIMFSLGSFISSRSVRYLINCTSHSVVLIIVEGGYMLAFLLAFLIFKDRKRKLSLSGSNEEIIATTEKRLTLKEIIISSFYAVIESVHVLIQERIGYNRLFLCLCILANFLDQFVWGEEKGLLGTYVRLPPFKWDTKTYANYKSLRQIVQIAGMVIGTIVLKKLFKMHDVLVIISGILSMALCVLMIGLAQVSWVIFASLAPGSLHGLLNPMTCTFMSYIVHPDEIGKMYAISSIAQKLAGIAQSLILQNIYIATVDWYQGFTWILMSVVALIAALIYFVIYLIAKRKMLNF